MRVALSDVERIGVVVDVEEMDHARCLLAESVGEVDVSAFVSHGVEDTHVGREQGSGATGEGVYLCASLIVERLSVDVGAYGQAQHGVSRHVLLVEDVPAVLKRGSVLQL